jgi:hypothetical protein
MTVVYDTDRTIILTFVLNECEIWSLTLGDECRLRVFENRVMRIFQPKRAEVTGEWGKNYTIWSLMICTPHPMFR